MDNVVVELKTALSDAKEEAEGAKTTTTQQADIEAKPLKVKNTVTYIVCGVVIEDGRVLMMKEAKESCHGLWYLPAGRLERNETLVDGVRREVLEETGLIFEPASLISFEDSTLGWFRFNFIGRITGGKLKTLAEQDKESMEAGWFTPFEILHHLPLRARDICPVIESALLWKETKMADPIFTTLPQLNPHSRISFQIILISKEENGMKVLIDNESLMGFLEITPTYSMISVKKVVKFVIGKAVTVQEKDPAVHGVVRVEHNGGPYGVADGVQLTFLAEVTLSSSPSTDRYQWCPVNDDNLCIKLEKLCEKGCINNPKIITQKKV